MPFFRQESGLNRVSSLLIDKTVKWITLMVRWYIQVSNGYSTWATSRLQELMWRDSEKCSTRSSWSDRLGRVASVRSARSFFHSALMKLYAKSRSICPSEASFSYVFAMRLEWLLQHIRHSTKGKKRLSRVEFITPFNESVGSSVTFAMRKQLQAEHGKADLEKQIEILEAKKKM